METLDFWVPGRPRTKGSLAGGRTGAGAERLVDSPQSKAWRAAVCSFVVPLIADEDVSVPVGKKGRWRLRAGWPSVETISVQARFFYRRSTHDGEARPTSTQYGDLDKLLRNVLDALQDSGVYKNDAQVVEVSASKWFAGDGWVYRDGDRNEEGARIIVSAVVH